MEKVKIIPCLDIKDGRVVKGINFVDLRDARDPVEADSVWACRVCLASGAFLVPVFMSFGLDFVISVCFVLCLGLSCPDVADNSLGDLRYATGRHTAPLFAGDTVFAATEITGKRDHERPDLGILETRLLGHKFERDSGSSHPDAPEGWKKVPIFELEREVVVKRRSHYL